MDPHLIEPWGLIIVGKDEDQIATYTKKNENNFIILSPFNLKNDNFLIKIFKTFFLLFI